MTPHPFSLRQLQYIVAVADLLSFRRAAEACHVSQPSLSAQLALAEDTLGLRIFERNRRRVLVTGAGEALVAHARRVLIAADELALAAKSAGDPLTGTLRIGVIPTISPYLLPTITPRLRASFPRLTLAWREDKTDVLVQQLDQGQLDAALLALEAELGEVEHALIARDPFVLVTRPDDPLAKRRTPASPAELRQAHVLVLDEGHCFRQQALEACAAAPDEFRATSLSTLVQMVAGGAGVTLLPTLAIATEATRAHLHVRPLAGGAHRTLALIWRRRSTLAPALHELAATIRAVYPTATGSPATPPASALNPAAVRTPASDPRPSRARSR